MSYSDPSGEFKVHGNWCGPDWTGGKKEQFSPDTADYKSPIDALDSSCRTHDMCYYNCRTDEKTKCDDGARSACFQRCDQGLARSAAQLGGPMASLIGATMSRGGNRAPGISTDCSCSAK